MPKCSTTCWWYVCWGNISISISLMLIFLYKKHHTLLPQVKLLVLLLCRERCSTEWILPLCYFQSNISCIHDNRLSSLLIYSPNVSFNYNSRWPSFGQPSVSRWRCRRSTTPQYRTNCGTLVTRYHFQKRNMRIFCFFATKNTEFHVNASFRGFKWLREKLVAYLKCQESVLKRLCVVTELNKQGL